MARPEPDPRQVVAVFEARHYAGLSYGQLVEWTHGHRIDGAEELQWEWDPISRGTAHAWYKAGLAWWIEHERLNPDEEAAGLRLGYGHMAEELTGAYRRKEIDVKTYIELGVKLGTAVQALVGIGRIEAEAGVVTVGPRAQAAIDEMKARREERDRGRARKVIG